MREFYKDYNVTSFLVSNTGAQMGGWFRKEIKTLEDMKGVKMRIGGFAGQVMAKLGVVPQQIAGGDIYPALEKGTIDAAEWVGPYDDQKLGFNKVAPYYYYPGWWEGSAAARRSSSASRPMERAAANATRRRSTGAAADTTSWWSPSTTRQNPKALRELVAAGTKFLPFPQSVLEACFNASNELYAETIGQERQVQEGLRSVEAVPQRRGAVVPRRREHLRQLHGPPVGGQQALAPTRQWPVERPRFGGAFSLPAPLPSVASHGRLIPLNGINVWQTKKSSGRTIMQRRKFLRYRRCRRRNDRRCRHARGAGNRPVDAGTQMASGV